VADPTPSTIRLHADDNVVVARLDLAVGARIEAGVVVRDPVPAAHKVAVRDIPAGAPVLKYATPIGVASAMIRAGEHVHLHNVIGQVVPAASAPGRGARSDVARAISGAREFEGYVRPDGRVATRNYVGIVTTVNCSGTVARMIAQQFDGERLGAFPGVDGVVPLAHTSGCAMSKTSDGFRVLRQTLAGYARHPNFAGVLVLGLGCEQNQTASLLEDFGLANDSRVRALVIQDQGGTRRAVDAGCKVVAEMLGQASSAKRVPVSASHLMLALECGGSDGHSGISANPALGVAADLLVDAGGTVVLSETPEIIGAEHLLLQRAVSREVAEQLERRVAWWLDYTRQHGVSIGDNPSEGNLRGGITTICEKSLGAVAKSGASPLRGVYGYADPIAEKGFVFMDSPGYDPVAVTGQVASGCNVICFTTGRGSVFGCRPVPSIKLSTNSALAERMEDDIDLDCGRIIEGRESVRDAGHRIFEFILATASGRQTCSEVLGFGVDEFVPWQLGPTL
jgi:altronate dehydratase